MYKVEINRKQILETFIKMIEHFTDKQYQKRAWIKGEAADFDEAVCLFFESGDPILENYKSFGITELQHKLLMKLRNEFEVFSNENNFPQKFIDTPEWEKIIEMAEIVLRAFNYNKFHN